MDINEVVRLIKEEMYEDELQAVTFALIERYDRLFPDWIVTQVSIPKNPKEERKRYLDCTVKRLMEEEYDPETGKPIF